jgi:hypothetical protein
MNTAPTPELTPSVHHFALRGLRRFRRWVAFLIIFFGAIGIVLGWMQAAERASQDRDWQALMDPRFGLGVGALFAAVANSYLIGALVPDTGEFSLADLVNLLGIVTILITLVESTVSLHLFDHCGQQDLSLSLDRTSFVVVSVGFVAAVALILLGASGRLWP